MNFLKRWMVGSCRPSGALIVILILLGAHDLRAQSFPDRRNFDANRLRPALSREGVLNVESGRTPGHLHWDIALWYNYVNDPVVLQERDERFASLLKDRHEGHLVLSLGVLEFLQFGLDLPVSINQRRSRRVLQELGLEELDDFGVGDLAITPKIRFLRQETLGIDASLLVRVTVPTAFPRRNYLGERTITGAPELALARTFGGLTIAGNLGVLFRDDIGLRQLRVDVDHEAIGRFGLAYDFNDVGAPFRINTSVAGFTRLREPFERRNVTGSEWLGSLEAALHPSVILFAGGGVGVAQSYSIPDWRAFGGIRIAPRTKPEPPPPPPPPVVDSDDDGFPDPEDSCPSEPEDRDGFEDEDGCLDPDNDGDGIADENDGAPDDPEDVDGFEDDDGIPDLDNDGDGVADINDQCPLEPGPADSGGCRERPMVVVRGCTFDLKQKVFFRAGRARIRRRSFQLLESVVELLRSEPQLKQIRVEGHTDSRGSKIGNERLSEKRAAAVRRFLVERGISPERVVSVGLGEIRPIESNATARGREANRRVEFAISDCVEESEPVPLPSPSPPRGDRVDEVNGASAATASR